MPITPRRLLLALLTLTGLAAAAPAGADAASPVWLCRPGLSDNPCEPSLKTTRFTPSGDRIGVDNVKRASDRKIDCFYIYPTVSGQSTAQASFARDPELKSVALFQAARYSRDCRVFAPVYRQVTVAGLFSGGATRQVLDTAYGDVRNAWRNYLKKYNKGRGVVVIGHSQGTYMLRRLLINEVDDNASVRRRLVSAILLGGDVQVKKGSDRGGDFRRITACRSEDDLGCVVAFSTYNEPTPENSLFGRVPSGGSALFGIPARAGTEVLCTNPTRLTGGTGRATPIVPTEPFAPGTLIGAGTLAVGLEIPSTSSSWAAFPKAYKAYCSSANGANTLQVRSLDGAPKLNPLPTRDWGLHLVDANIALGNLADLVRDQAASYVRARSAVTSAPQRPAFAGSVSG